MFTRLFVTAVVVSALAVPWSPAPAGAIANGTGVKDGDHRFAVLLTMTGLPADDGGTRDSWCSGALIAPRWVITAGHCFRDAGGRRVSRTVAERTVAVLDRTEPRGPGGREAEVVAVVQADGADVALAELRDPVTGVPTIRVAGDPPVRGEVLRLTGFGLTGADGGGSPPDRLQTGLFTVDAFGDSLVETSGREPHRDTSPCPHDSGGPYFRESPDAPPVLVAVVSSGPGCPHTGPDLSARVDNLAGWITETTTSQRSTVPVAAAGAGVGAAALVIVWAVLRRRSGTGGSP
ncbi:S1 family peptidase [Actinoplanes sp. G11-F43]|uniref:S1 family peptidase n=1 Tax=Actinoplanes sp. G11-F43 TaxID=3424130 RepID=UPI003D32EB9A